MNNATLILHHVDIRDNCEYYQKVSIIKKVVVGEQKLPIK